MKLPATVQIGALPFEVVVVQGKASRDGELGSCAPGNTRLELDAWAMQQPGQDLVTFFHELMHALCYERGLPLKHREVDQLGSALAACIAVNGWVFDPAPQAASERPLPHLVP